MPSRGELMDRNMVWGLRLLFLGVDVFLPRPVITSVLVGRSSTAVRQQLAPAKCGGSFSVVPFSMACGAHLFPLSPLFYSLCRYAMSGIPLVTSNRRRHCPSVALLLT